MIIINHHLSLQRYDKTRRAANRIEGLCIRLHGPSITVACGHAYLCMGSNTVL